MEEYQKYNFTLTISDLQKIVNAGMNVIVTINGMYYELKKDGKEND